MTYRGRVRNGEIVLDQPVSLPEGAEVEVQVRATTRTESAAENSGGRSILDGLRDLVGKAPGLPADLAENHDHYLYGRPKRAS